MHFATEQPAEIERRMRRAQQAAAAAGLDALIISSGADLRYLTGYDAHLNERLTALVIRADGEATLVCPELEQSLAAASPAAAGSVAVAAWAETASPYELAASLIHKKGDRPAEVAVSDRMWAQHLFGLRDAVPSWHLSSAAPVLAGLRSVKSAAEIEALRGAGAAIDTVHAQVGELLRIGRSEREVAADLARAIVDAGHLQADFTIVGSGPNGASPHHEYSDRTIDPGDLVVIDIGGPMPDGYQSDSTRTYVVGESTAYDEMYAVLHAAHRAAVEAVRPGATCESIDAAARTVIADAGLGERFIHRTGHGIGLEGHEHPYIVAGNETPLVEGMTFSIEPGIYFGGEYGARLEDIVCVGSDGAILLNDAPRELVHVAG